MSLSISIIVATYNSDKHLAECLRSVVNQTYTNWELIIIDGGSTDNTVSIIKEYERYIKYWVTEQDSGIYDAWNKGLKAMSTHWVCFVGSDDVLHAEALGDYATHISFHPQVESLEFVSSYIELVDEHLNHLKTVGAAWEWNTFKVSMTTWHVGCMHSRLLFEKYGLFDSSFKISGDYELLLRPADKLVSSFVNKVTAKMRNGGVSSNQLMKASKETYMAKIKNHIISRSKGYALMIVDSIRLYIRK